MLGVIVTRLGRPVPRLRRIEKLGVAHLHQVPVVAHRVMRAIGWRDVGLDGHVLWSSSSDIAQSSPRGGVGQGLRRVGRCILLRSGLRSAWGSHSRASRNDNNSCDGIDIYIGVFLPL